MHLFELCDTAPPHASESVPEWTLGCFRRRCITFFTGAEDTQTEVLWLQSRGLTADFRRAPGTAKAPSARSFGDLSSEELLSLSRVEAGLSRTRHDGTLMSWSGWASFQLHARWPEPGRLERVGNCLVEHAPSGAYVEDWRFEPAGAGPLIGLSLIDERDVETGEVLHRGGGLVVCGRHAAFVRGRPQPLPEGGRLEDFVRAHLGDPTQLAQAFAFDAAYATRAPGASDDSDYTVSLATLPWRAGQALLGLGGFSRGEHGLVMKRVEEAGRSLERRFEVDTLEREFGAGVATPATPAAARWLEREGDALLATSR